MTKRKTPIKNQYGKIVELPGVGTVQAQSPTEPTPPVLDYAAVEVRLAVVGNTLSLLAHAPSLLNPDAIKQAENLVAQCRELLLASKPQQAAEG